MALDSKGFMRPTYEEILADRIEQARVLFGEDIETDETTALGKFIRLAVYDLAKAWEALELCYYARFPNTASGISLDRLCPFAGITRNPPTRAEHEVKFTGSAKFVVPVGFLVGTESGVEFYLVNDVTLDSTGAGTGVVACTELGPVGNVTLGDITEIVNPDASVHAIAHTDIVTIAEDTETDSALRLRFAQTVSGSGSATAASIKGEVMRVQGVKGCVIVENQEDTTDKAGRPPHSFECYVYAPASADAEIAKAIFSKKPLGIKSHGSTAVEITASSGEIQEVKFSHTQEISIRIKLSIAKDDTFENDGVDKIKTALIAYINSLGNGEDVVYTALYGGIHSVTGVRETTSLTISSDGSSYGTSNIIVNAAQIAVASADNITVEVSNYEDR